jgi:hypothetical protein
VWCQGARDADTLLLAAGEFVWVAPKEFVTEPDIVQQ